MKRPVNNLIVVSDLHCGCQLGLCPPEVTLDEGGTHHHSRLQAVVWGWWQEFWRAWVPDVCRGEPYAVAINGDTLDGVHHGATTQISHNLADQAKIAEAVLRPVVKACGGRFYMIRGTEAHVGPSGAQEEELARHLGAIRDEDGRSARYELWVAVGGGLVHLAHHIGTTGSMAYETTALCKEYSEACAEAGRWGLRAPDVVVRSHRHRHAETRVPQADGYGICCVTPGWQLRTPFAFRMPGGRQATPQVGGTLVRCGDEDVFTRHRVWNIERTKTAHPKYERA
jgi:hypothetical protein